MKTRLIFPIFLPFFQRKEVLFAFSFLLGATSSFAFPPFSWWFVLVFSFSGFLLILRQQDSFFLGFGLGWAFGLGYFAGSTFWVAFSFRVVGLGFLVPVVIIIFSSFLALFPACVAALTVHWQRTSWQQVILFSALWSFSEWVRGHIFTGFPWNLLGHTWGLPLLQSTAWVGIYGLSLLTVLLATVWSSRSFTLLGATLSITIAVGIGGDYRLKNSERLGKASVNLRLVQPSIQQSMKWSPHHFQEGINLCLALSHLDGELPLDAVLWPEAAVPASLTENSELRKTIALGAPEHGVLITGGINRLRGERETIKNSLFVLDERGDILENYDKTHLVPFGEYIPLKSLLPFKKLTEGTIDYTPGVALKTVSVAGLPPFSPLICYEAIFPNAVVGESSLRPLWLLNLTNDAWFGRTSGPYQHLSIVRVRAIEEGLPLVRVANNGISAVIDPYGVILDRLELDDVGIIDFALPKSLTNPTFYSRWGDIPILVVILIFFFIARFSRYDFHRKCFGRLSL